MTVNKNKTISNIASKEIKISNFAEKYFARLHQIFKGIDLNKLDKLEKVLLKARSNQNTIFVFGNGGSAATASTMANDLGFDILKKTSTKKPFKFFALTDNTPVITAISNDVGYENVILNQLKIHFKKNDIAIFISASGNSKNLLKAAKWIKHNNGKVLSFLGFDGGKLRKISDINILVKSEKGEYGPVEDCHLIINHILAHWFQSKI
tara:strand:- start:245 stop:868 length:624 start_codon:yes stop_codon:yes gene_type:complete